MKQFWAWLCSKVTKKKVVQEPIKPIVNGNGVCIVMVEHIESADNTVRHVTGETPVEVALNSLGNVYASIAVPKHVLKLVRTLSASYIAQTVIEVQNARANDYVAMDKSRALALASCFYNFEVPYNAILIDGLTKAYLHQILRAQVPRQVYVFPPGVIKKGSAYEVQIPPEEVLKKYVRMLPHVGAVIGIFAAYPIMPPRIAMYEEMKLRAGNIVKRFNNNQMPTEDEFFMLATVYASLSKIKLPESYVEDGLTTKFIVAAVQEPKPKKPQLSVVKNS